MIITDELAEKLQEAFGETPGLDDLHRELADQVKQNKARFILLRLDETHDWTLDLGGARAFGVYLVDLSEKTFCCELTPSYTLYPLYHYTDSENEKLREAVSEEPMDSQITYMHCMGIDALMQVYPATRNDLYVMPGHDKPIDTVHALAESYDKLVEETAENYRANHVL
jgi:hypothetical protein